MKLYAKRHGQMDILKNQETIEVRGEHISDHVSFIEWKSVTGKDLRDRGHTGIEIREIRNTVCSGCYANLTPQFLNELKKRDSLLLCDSCGRILIYVDTEKDI